MVRVRCRVVVVHMARCASGWQSGVVAAHMTLRAGHCRVQAGQRELGHAVVEGCGLPSSGAVANRAGCGQASRFVVGVSCAVVILDVARGAVGRDSGVLAPHVARGTRHRRVLSGQREFRVFRVVELRS